MKRLFLFGTIVLLVISALSIVNAQEAPDVPQGRDTSLAIKAMQNQAAQSDGIVMPMAIQEAGNTIYRVLVEDTGINAGTYSAKTGTAHPSPNQNVLYGAVSNVTSTNYTTIRSYTSSTDYPQRGNPASSFGVTALSGFYTGTTPISTTGYQTTWSLPGGTVQNPDNLLIVQDWNVEGTTLNDSRIALSTSVTNRGGTTVLLGIRYLWDYQIGTDDGPTFTQRNPDGAVLVNETTFAPPGFEFYHIEGNSAATTFTISGTANGPNALQPSQANPLKFVCWSSAVGQAFDYATTGANCVGGSGTTANDTAVLYYFGATSGSAISVPPGETVTVTEYVFAVPPVTAPVAVDDEATINGLNPVTVSVLANDFDLDGDTVLLIAATQPAFGTATLNVNGTITYTPTSTCPPATDSFTYTISDGTQTDTAIVTITQENCPPSAVNDTATTFVASLVNISVLSNDTDPDGDPLTVTATTTPANGTAVINPDGTIGYTPNAGYVGTDTFTYTISDGAATASATVTVNVINRPPTAVDDTATTNVATPVIVAVLANDTDPDGQALSVTSVTVPSIGTAVINPDGTVSYTPPALFVGTATFQYTISDGFDSATATVTVNVINRPPSAVDDLTSTPMNTLVVVSVLANDSDADGHPLTVTAVSAPANGTAVINPDDTVIYTPNPAFLGIDSFTYTISDGYDTATATVTITVAENCTDADRNPELHLDHEESLLLVDTGYRTGRIINRSLNCSYEVGIASYRMFDNVIDNQELLDFETAVIPPGRTLELTVDLADCATQVDLFYGTLLTSLVGQRYGDRLIDGLQLNVPNFCIPAAPTAP